MRTSAVYASVRLIAESIASLPLSIYERNPDDTRRKASDHRAYPLVHDEPNASMTSFTWRETMVAHLCLRGNCYSYLETDRSSRLIGIWPMHPNIVEPERLKNGSLVYRTYDEAGNRITLEAWQVLHVPGLGWDGIKGLSPIGLQREAIGLSIATEQFGSRYFSGGARPGGVLSTDQQLSEPQSNIYRASWEQAHQGLANAHKVAVLGGGLKWTQIGVSPEDSQFLETRRFQVQEIARMFRIPPHMIGASSGESLTYSTVEQESIEFVQHTLRPWIVRFEQELNRKIFSTEDTGRYYCEFNVDGLLRADVKTRYESYAIGVSNGWLSPDEIRQLENMNPRSDGKGGDYKSVDASPAVQPPKGGQQA